MAAYVTLFKFLGGEEVLAEITSESDTSFNVKNPVRIVVIPDQLNPKTPQVGLAPYMQFSETKELAFNKALIITTAAPLTEFVNQYNGLFGGIQVPSSKIITP